MSLNIGNVLKIAQMALNAAPSEVALVHGLIQSKKSGGTVGLLGSILTALPEEIELVSTIIAAIHANNQPNVIAAPVAATPVTSQVEVTSLRPVPGANEALAPSPTELAAQQANQTPVQKPS